MSLAAARTLAGVMWFDEPAWSWAPHFDGHQRGPIGVAPPVAGGVWACATCGPAATRLPAATPLCMNVRRETPSAGEADDGIVSWVASTDFVRMNCCSQPDCMAFSSLSG